MGWDFTKLKVSEEPPKFSLYDDNTEVLSGAQSLPLRLRKETNILSMDEKSKHTGRCKSLVY